MADFFVTNTNDSGAGSLRQALADAEEINSAGHDQIIFDAAISGQTIRLTSGALEITSGSVYINGDIDADGDIDITISGDATGDGRTSDDSALLNVGNDATVILDSLVLADGYALGTSGADYGYSGTSAHVISNSGSLTIANTVLQNNFAGGGGGGDGDFNNFPQSDYGGGGGDGSLIATGTTSTTFITDTVFTGNFVSGGDGGDGTSALYGFPGGGGGDAALISNQGNLELRNAISYFNTIDAGTGGNGGDSSSQYSVGVSGAAGGDNAQILNAGILTGVFGTIGDTVGGSNAGGSGGLGVLTNGYVGPDGLSVSGRADVNGGTSPDFGFFSQGLAYSFLQDQNFLNAVGNPLWLMGGNDFVSLAGGSPEADIIAGGAGIDNLFAGGGDDVVEGGLGNDVMSGGSNGAAGDTLTFAGFASRDGVYGVTFNLEEGNNYQVQFTGAGYDMAFGFENLTGSRYNDRLGEGLGINIIRGGLGNDTIVQSAGLADSTGETFDGGKGTDTLYLGGGVGFTSVNNLRGDNLLSFERLYIADSGGGSARHVLLSASQFGGNGITSNASVEFNFFNDNSEVIDIAMEGVNVLNLSQLVISGDLTNVNFLITGDGDGETITGTTIRDVINGEGGADILRGGGGNDVLNGGAGIDNLIGGAGDDTLSGGSEADVLNGQGNVDTLNGDVGNDTLLGGSGDDILNGGDDDDTLDGQGNNDTLKGDAGLDELRGSAGNDKLFGGADADLLIGGIGVDLLDGGTGNDIITNGASDGVRDTIVFKDGYDLDRVNGFDQVGTDRLQLNDNLWLGTHGVLTAAQVVSTFGTINGTGTLITLNFGDGDILQVQNTGGLNLVTLSSDILIV